MAFVGCNIHFNWCLFGKVLLLLIIASAVHQVIFFVRHDKFLSISIRRPAPLLRQDKRRQPNNKNNKFSSIQDSKFQDDFLILHNVCLSKGEEYAMHFFVHDENDKQITELFSTRSIPYGAWESDIVHIKPLIGILSTQLHVNTTIQDFVTQHINATFIPGTSLVAEPHHPDNNFHLFNDLILQVLYRILKSNSTPNNVKLFLTHGNRKRFENRVIAFDILYKLLNEVVYPLEVELASNHHPLCFQELLWGGRSAFPYYKDVGRFGVDDKWNGVIPKIRDVINQAYGIHTSIPRSNNNNVTKPTLTWVPRTCTNEIRCMTNVTGLLSVLETKFHIQQLSLDRHQSREEQLQDMLQQMSQTHVLMGFHGAGLGHAVFLQPYTMLVELKDSTQREKKLFINMANKQQQQVGYYMFDAMNAVVKGKGTVLTFEEMMKLRNDLWHAWQQQQQQQEQQHDDQDVVQPNDGKCLFPQYLGTTQLSTFEQSKCFLEKKTPRSKYWVQCVHYHECP